MTFNSGTYEWIDRYLKGTLSEEEKALFEKQQDENPALAEEVKLQSLLNDLVFEKGLADIRKKVGEDLSNAKGTSGYRTLISFAAGLCLVTGCVLYFSLQDNERLRAPEKPGIKKNEQPTTPSLKETPAVSSLKETRKVPSPAEVQKEKMRSKEPGRPLETAKPASPVNEVKTPVPVESPDVHTVKDTTGTTETRTDSLKEKKAEITKPTSQQEPCKDIIFEVKTEPSCSQKQNGKIQILISGIKGGSEPYSYSIAGKDFGLESVNNTLGKGNYPVRVKDDKGCISEKRTEVTEKTCVEFEDYWFNPTLETWKFPLKEHETGSITIVDQGGRIVYNAKIIYGNPDSWNGKSLNGDILESGSYLYIIESNGVKIKQGYITIIY